MNASATLRHLTLLLVLALAAPAASATDHGKKATKAAAKVSVEPAAKPQRKEVAAFVDPTAPLAELVERERTERSAKATEQH